MFKYHFCFFKMELYLSGTDSYLIQIFKWTLKSWELIAANSLFHAVFTTLPYGASADQPDDLTRMAESTPLHNLKVFCN